MISRYALLFCVLAIASLSATGCELVNDPSQHVGGAVDGGGDAAAAPRIESNELCDRLAALECDQYVRCCSTAPAPADFDRQACLDAVLPPCRDAIGPYLADGRTGYDAEVAARVIAEGEALSADCSLEIAGWAVTREGFFGVFTGSVEPAGECTPTNAMDSAAFLSCDRLENACIAASGSRFLCAPRVGRDASCLLNYDCIDGLACIRAIPGAPESGRCTDPLRTGDVCRQASDCESYLCHIPTGVMVGTCALPTQDNVYCGVVE